MNGTGGIHLGTNVRFDVANATADDAADLLVTMRLDNGGAMGTTGSLSKLGAGTLVLDNAFNSFTGGVTVEAGVLRVASAGSLSTGDIIVTGGLLDLGNFAFAGNITLAGGMVINTGGWTGTGTANPAFTVDPAFLAGLAAGSSFSILPGMTADISGIAAAIDFRGGALQGVGSYAGALSVSAGTLDLSGGNPLGTLALAGTGVIDFGGRATDIAIAYSGGSLLNADDYTGEITVFGASTTLVAGTLGGGTVVAGNGRLLVFGANFANNVRIIGGSVLNLENFEGTLFVGAGSSINLGNPEDDTSVSTLASLVIEAGGTLSGQGTVASLTLSEGGTLAVGNSPGVITVTNDLTLTGGTQRFEVRNAVDTLTGGPATPGEDYDFVLVQGTLDLSGLSAENRFLLELISLTETDTLGALADFDPAGTYQFTLYEFTGLNLGSNSAGSLNSLFTIDADGFFDMNGDAVDSNLFSVMLNQQNNTLVLSYGVVPEPSTYGLMLGALALALSAWRRRRKPAPLA
jgi:autotransporter-associated beta strand protein